MRIALAAITFVAVGLFLAGLAAVGSATALQEHIQ